MGAASSLLDTVRGFLPLGELSWVFALVFVLLGVIFCFFGWRMIRPVSVLLDAVVGVLVGNLLSDTLLVSLVASFPWLRFVLMLALAALCGYLTHKLFFVILYVDELAGIALGLYLGLSCLLPPDLFVLTVALSVILAIPISIVTYHLIIPLCILSTSVIGGAMMVMAVMLLADALPSPLPLVVFAGAVLVGIFVQVRAEILAKSNRILGRFGNLLSHFGYHAGQLADDFREGFSQTFGRK